MASSHRELVRSWLEKARHDLETARCVIEHEPPITDTAVYHCQQAAEKALKAVMIHHGQAVFKTHDLMALTTHCAKIDPDFKGWVDAAAILTPYATHYRYPCNEPDSSRTGYSPRPKHFDQDRSAVENVRDGLNTPSRLR